MSDTLTYWVGERKHLALTVLDGTTPLTDYTVALLPFGAKVSTATWVANVVYNGKRGVWVDQLTGGTYQVIAKVGTQPNEVDFVVCGTVVIRSR